MDVELLRASRAPSARLHTWTPDSDGFVEPFDINGDIETNGDQEVAVDFGANGLWVYDNTDASWTQLSALDPVFMVAGDYWDHGYRDTLAVDFGAIRILAVHGRHGGLGPAFGAEPGQHQLASY